MVPPPRRGEVVRQIGAALREHKADLGLLVTLETGKIRTRRRGRSPGNDRHVRLRRRAVPPALWVDDRQRAGERHRMMEQWHPLGPLGIITAFNFPVAVWAWNAMIAAVCGDTMVWKPSPRTPLTAVAVQRIVDGSPGQTARQGLFQLCVGGSETRRSDARGPSTSVDLRDRELPDGATGRRGRGGGSGGRSSSWAAIMR